MNNTKTPFGGKPYVRHSVDDTPKLARDHLINLGCSKKAVDQLFDKKGNWKYQIDREFDPFTYSATELEQMLLNDLAPVYDLVNNSLDAIYEYGFNKHDLDHIIDVTRVIHKLLEEADADPKTKNIGIIASVAHDLGNILSRKSHSKISPILFKQIFPNIQITKEDWLRIKDAIRYHDEHVINEVVESFKAKSPNEKVKMFRKTFRLETLALVVADKTAVNRKRLSDKPKTQDALSSEHVEVNLLGQTDSIVIKKDSAVVTFHFRPFANKEEFERYPHYFQKTKHGTGFRASVSEETRKLHEFETPIDYFSVWRHKYWKVYADRTILYTYSLFAMFPHIKSVKIKMVDFISPGSNSFEEVEYNINIDELFHFEKFVKVKYLKKS